MPRSCLPLPPLRLLGADRVGWLPRVWRGLEGHRRQPWPRLSEESARRGYGYSERRPGTMVLPHSQREEYRPDNHALADITEEEFRVLELIEAEQQEQINRGDGTNGSSR